jgi:eight-cysteine-cluster-containing protein
MKIGYLVPLVLIFVACVNQESLKSDIIARIDSANFCQKSSDCTSETFGCPFGCNNLVNNNADLGQIRSLIKKYNEISPQCVYKCPAQPKNLICENNKCVGLLNKECTTDSECAKGGCSGELCMPKSQIADIMTACVIKPEYECLKLTTCVCNEGKCSWQENKNYSQCLQKY